MSKPRVLVTSHEVPEQAIQLLQEKCEVDIYDGDYPIPQDTLLKRVAGVDALLCLLTDKVNLDVLESAGPNLKAVATMSVGFDHIDVEECKKRTIGVSNTPEVSTDSVAEFTVSLLLTVGRRLVEANTAFKNGEWRCPWRPVWLCGHGVHGSIVGIVGMGRIGRAVMKRLQPFGVEKILYYDIYHPVKAAEDEGAVFADFDELLGQSDYVVSMCNLSEKTKHMFDARAFSLMKSNAVFINTARGGLVNQEDLYDALKQGKIRGAGLDVMDPEPLPMDHPLTTLSNIVLTPHIGSAEINVRTDMAILAANNLLAAVSGQPLLSPVY